MQIVNMLEGSHDMMSTALFSRFDLQQVFNTTLILNILIGFGPPLIQIKSDIMIFEVWFSQSFVNKTLVGMLAVSDILILKRIYIAHSVAPT